MVETTSVRGEVTFEALGKTWRFKLGHAAYEQIEIEMGKRFDVVMNMFESEDTSMMKLLRVLIKAGLLRFQPEVTNDVVSDIIDDIGFEASMKFVQSAIEASAPKPKENETKN